MVSRFAWNTMELLSPVSARKKSGVHLLNAKHTFAAVLLFRDETNLREPSGKNNKIILDT